MLPSMANGVDHPRCSGCTEMQIGEVTLDAEPDVSFSNVDIQIMHGNGFRVSHQRKHRPMSPSVMLSSVRVGLGTKYEVHRGRAVAIR